MLDPAKTLMDVALETEARADAAPPRICVEDKMIVVEGPAGAARFHSRSLPQRYIDWITAGRRSMYDRLLDKDDSFHFFASHLPVLVTLSKGKPFPLNCSNKGVGFIPKDPHLGEFIELFERTLHDTQGKHWKESLAQRIGAVSQFYFDHEKIDYRALTGLEIFARNTFQNLVHTPQASLLFTGGAPNYTSFQVNCVAEIIGEGDLRHQFVKLARIMFEYDDFHIAQKQFPFAYIFWISEVIDKTPFRVEPAAGEAKPAANHSLRWQRDALDTIGRAPEMIQNFIREKIEDYAREHGRTEVDFQLVQEARGLFEKRRSLPKRIDHDKTAIGPEMKYSRIYIPVDGSELSAAATRLGLEIGKLDQAEIIGSHVYAAKLHDSRFKIMEGGLPEAYQREEVLEEQRKIHDSLITQGLELISDSYLQTMERQCREHQLPFRGVSLEGRNWEELARDINSHDYDLVILGGHGIGRVSHSLLGTVTARLLRRVRRDLLICKRTVEENASDMIVVCLDGSPRSWGGFHRGIHLAKSHSKRLVAISAFDPYFHYAMFKSLNKTLSDQARSVFKFEEHEKLHEDIIDSGLAKIYQSNLNIARKIGREAGLEVETHLLDGKPFEKILQFLNQNSPWLTIMGRTGIHSDEEMDLGGHTENVCHLADFNLLIVGATAKPPAEYQAEETVTWTKEAQAKMEQIPAMARGIAVKAIQNYCLTEGHTVVTGSVLNAAIKELLPSEAIQKMGITFDENEETAEAHGRITLTFECQDCGHAHRGSRPQVCPICGQEGSRFKIVESQTVRDGIPADTLGDRSLIWEKDCLEILNQVGDEVLRRQIRLKLEKWALTRHLTSVTLEMLQEHLPKTTAPETNTAARSTHGLGWTDAAVERLNRAPEGFMRDTAKTTVENYAREIGAVQITLEIVEQGLIKAREKMSAALGNEAHDSPNAPHPIPKTARANPEKCPFHRLMGVFSFRKASYECELCGLVIDSSHPGQCPACQGADFRKLSQVERKNASPCATRPLEWDEAALQRLERVPAGFMRNMTRARIEFWARKTTQDKITLEVVQAKYASWEKGGRGIQRELEWTVEALRRVEAVPDFIRPIVIREIEARMKKRGTQAVTAEALDQVIRSWVDPRSFHQQGSKS